MARMKVGRAVRPLSDVQQHIRSCRYLIARTLPGSGSFSGPTADVGCSLRHLLLKMIVDVRASWSMSIQASSRVLFLERDRRLRLTLDRKREDIQPGIEPFTFRWNRLNAGILCPGEERGATRCEYRYSAVRPLGRTKTL